MMKYEYADIFMIKGLEDETVQKCEDMALREVDKLNIKDVFYYEKLVILNVYIQLGKINYEDEVVQKKYKLYSNEYRSLIKDLKKEKKEPKKPTVKSVKIFRG